MVELPVAEVPVLGYSGWCLVKGLGNGTLMEVVGENSLRPSPEGEDYVRFQSLDWGRSDELVPPAQALMEVPDPSGLANCYFCFCLLLDFRVRLKMAAQVVQL